MMLLLSRFSTELVKDLQRFTVSGQCFLNLKLNIEQHRTMCEKLPRLRQIGHSV